MFTNYIHMYNNDVLQNLSRINEDADKIVKDNDGMSYFKALFC